MPRESGVDVAQESLNSVEPPLLPPRPKRPSSPNWFTVSRISQPKIVNDNVLELVPPRTLRAAIEAQNILEQLAQYIKAADSSGAIQYIQRLYETPNLLPSLMFDHCNPQKIDREVATMIMKYVKSFTTSHPNTWKFDGVGVIGRILVLTCGPSLWWQQNKRHCTIFDLCLQQVGDRFFPICYWLFTAGEDVSDLMLQLLWSGSITWQDNIDRRMACVTFAHDLLRNVNHQVFLEFVHRLLMLPQN